MSHGPGPSETDLYPSRTSSVQCRRAVDRSCNSFFCSSSLRHHLWLHIWCWDQPRSQTTGTESPRQRTPAAHGPDNASPRQQPLQHNRTPLCRAAIRHPHRFHEFAFPSTHRSPNPAKCCEPGAWLRTTFCQKHQHQKIDLLKETHFAE